ncbi:branched-chain amino acid ABC transporter permease [Deinococcus metallilatus]|uniref:Branched-chain amino acid ABC transporter permease n=1 Tax=Deinococcus metallilatus TaxID=1211322 RepID=A0AAJ5F2V2_9DEIO|nr:branched-chain amino acid ABC transporter permease [Deinococcus metallilatus]MBB5296229.1 branched-chain amino acid transport system permease protein [Deinococcus metallilatus]QBY09724.1 branched-chain amino acid ABC transporter permease [Deinococcus metallilatus]RXJ08922.1 branched-chain amino acid ABC transporter permease [Deinococcus metallilatus]TLK23699.1 branched-chain amino acid ABC transporter permease [Deinococcus metallilatus]GMA14095.1 branched-chain amino acid ABC transporter pe
MTVLPRTAARTDRQRMTRAAWLIGLGIVLLILPRLIYPVLALDILAWGLFAVAFDLLFGFSGLLSFGHAAFWGTSAYVTAFLLSHGQSVPVAMLGGTASALLIAVPIGYLSVRSIGIYFSMITLAFAQMISFVALQWTDVTGGENGLQGFARPSFLGLDFSDSTTRYYFCLVLFAIGFYVAYRTVRSPFGQALQAVRDNEQRAQSIGYNPTRFKFTAFLISAALAGLAGSMFTFAHGVVSLDVLNWRTSGEVVMMTLLGGTTTLFGPVIGAGLVLLLRDTLTTANLPVGIVTGLVFVLVVLFFRRGVVGTVQYWLRRR